MGVVTLGAEVLPGAVAVVAVAAADDGLDRVALARTVVLHAGAHLRHLAGDPVSDDPALLRIRSEPDAEHPQEDLARARRRRGHLADVHRPAAAEDGDFRRMVSDSCSP